MKNSPSKLALAAAIGLALTFAFSCSSDNGGNNNGGGNGGSTEQTYSYCIKADNTCLVGPFTVSACNGQVSNNCPSSSSVASSSPSVPSSSSIASNPNAVYGTPVTYGGETYKTVVIGSQTWFQRNLNYATEGSKCNNDDPANCATYGRLYDWNTAMTVCPSGWRLPSNEDWDVLVNYAGGESVAGKKLKATGGWNSYNGVSGNGTDDFGFMALAGGTYASGFSVNGGTATWWTSTEYLGSYAYNTVMDFWREGAYHSSMGKNSAMFSVRCVQGNSSPINPSSPSIVPSSSSVVSSSSSLVPSSSSVMSSSSSVVRSSSSSSSFSYTSKGNNIANYKTTRIGTQTWMAENLDYDVSGSHCTANCETYGRKYDWATAMDIDAKYNSEWWDYEKIKINTKHRGICPSGWHIPSDAEWKTLIDFVGGQSIAGTKLKATSGWDDCGNGSSYTSYKCEDTYGFSALPSGGVYNGWWWTATESGGYRAYDRGMSHYNDRVYSDIHDKNEWASVRCLQD